MIYKTREFVFFEKKDCKKLSLFLKYVGVKEGTYAGNVATRIYNEFFEMRFSLKGYYKKYYKKEFKNCKGFLINRFNISEELSNKLVKKKYYFTYRQYKKDMPSYYFSFDEAVRDCFVKFVGGVDCENTNGICDE